MLIQDAIMNDPRYNQGLTRVVVKRRIEDCKTAKERSDFLSAKHHFEKRKKFYLDLGYTERQAILAAM